MLKAALSTQTNGEGGLCWSYVLVHRRSNTGSPSTVYGGGTGTTCPRATILLAAMGRFGNLRYPALWTVCIGEYTGREKGGKYPRDGVRTKGLGATRRILDGGSGPHTLVTWASVQRFYCVGMMQGWRSLRSCGNGDRAQENQMEGPRIGRPHHVFGERGPRNHFFTCPQCPARTDEAITGVLQVLRSDSGNLEC